MRTLVNPRWLFVINTLPVIILLILFWNQYQDVHVLLEKESIVLWQWFGATLAILGVLHITYTLRLIQKGQKLSAAYGIAVLITYAAYVCVYGQYTRELLPFTIPRWMVSRNTLLYVGTFLMPTMAHALFVLVIRWTNEQKDYKAWFSFLMAIAVPMVSYLFARIVLPLWQPVDYNFREHVMVILAITAAVVFLFFLVRGIYIISIKKAGLWSRYRLAWEIPIAIILPLLGLAINNGVILKQLQFMSTSHGIFGNYNNAWFYILALINGLLVCLPNNNHKTYRIALFIGRTITFAFTFYFFLVFLPFLPMSVVVILAFGVGFLMLTPLLLFIIQSNTLYKDFSYLQGFVPKNRLLLIAILCFLVLPIAVTLSFLYDKSVLNEALAYVYTPNYSQKPVINRQSLQYTLNVVEEHKSRDNNFITDDQTPYLSAYFNWLVMDNLTLSDTKLYQLRHIFLGEPPQFFNTDPAVNTNTVQDVILTGTKVQTVYDDVQQAWQSTVELELTNTDTIGWNKEYITTFELPVGCWINDYYLWIGNRREQGILAEKKAATWVYNQITSANRDPGILYYLTGNRVAFKVFPFTKSEVRKTAISFIHKEPVTITIDSTVVVLGNNKVQPLQQSISSADGSALYVPVVEKQRLAKVTRTPYYHFIIDGSKNHGKAADQYIQDIQAFLQKDTIAKAAPQFTFTNTYIQTLEGNWQEQLKKQTFEGGFFLERALQQIFVSAYKKPTTSYPIIVVVTDNLDNAVLEKDFADYSAAFPEGSLFYELKRHALVVGHSLLHNPGWATQDSTIQAPLPVLAYPSREQVMAYLPDNAQPSIIVKNKTSTLQLNDTDKAWLAALAMQGNWIAQTFHPQKTNASWLALVKGSFRSKVMMPVTSYLAVENEAQKVALKRKQEEVLAGNKLLDVDDETQRMSEPNLWVLVVLLVMAWLYKTYKQRRLRQL